MNSTQTVQQVIQFRVQIKKSTKKNANYRDYLVTTDQERARLETIRLGFISPSLAPRMVKEIYVADWKLAKKEILK